MGKVVLITGGSSGIGKSIGEYLSAKGFVVYGTSRDASKIESHPFPLISLDVTKVETISAAVQEVITREGRLDILINNAGMGITGPIEDTPTDEMRKVFDTNFFGAIDVMKAVLPQMRKQKDGIIFNITSIAGYMGLPFRGIYSATKGALELVTEATSMEVKQFGIKVINVEIKHIDLNDSMIRAIAKQAEAERERRAKVINAEGEYQASEKLLAAANVISQNPQALQLRYLQTLNDISTNENTNTIVFPFPVEMMRSILKDGQPQKTQEK